MKYSVTYQIGGQTMTYEIFNQKYLDLIYYMFAFNREYSEGWVLSGSSALMLYAYAYLSKENFQKIIQPNDVDILINFEPSGRGGGYPHVPNSSITVVFPGGSEIFTREQTSSNPSVTFLNNSKKIDASMYSNISTTATTLYNIPIININKLQNIYGDPFTGNPIKKQIIDQIIMNITQPITNLDPLLLSNTTILIENEQARIHQEQARIDDVISKMHSQHSQSPYAAPQSPYAAPQSPDRATRKLKFGGGGLLNFIYK